MLTPAMRAICLPYRSDPLTLTLLVTRFRANDSHHAVAPDDLAVAADLLHRCQYFHCRFSVNRRASTRAAEIFATAEPCLPVPASLGAENDPRPRQVVRRQVHRHLVARQNLYVVHPHLAGDVSQHYMTIFQLHP